MSKGVKKHKRNKSPEKNVVYLITCKELEEQRKYIIGKTIDLMNRLNSYDKISDFKVVYYKGFKTEDDMGLAENMVLNKLDSFREKVNRDRFILPVDKDITFFTDIFNLVYSFF
jgi:hypothetical protein